MTVLMKKLFVILAGGVIGLWLAGLAAFNYKINHFEIDTQTKTDAIVVLTGGRHRLSEAVELLNNGISERLFISGVQKNISLNELERRDDITIKTGREITLDKIASNTFENARETCLWIEKHNIRSIRLVTSNYHLLRSLVEFRRWNKQVKIVLHPVFSEKVSSIWYKSFYSFYFLAQEYNKFLFAWARAMVCNVSLKGKN